VSGPRTRYVFVEWTEPAPRHDGDSRYRGANYPAADVPKLLDALRKRGVVMVYVDDVETPLGWDTAG
jgi:hypothetical protein